MAEGNNTVTAGALPEGANVDRSASGLQYQRYQQEQTARGVNGMARRVAAPADSLFSNPPISGGQFAGGHAKSIVSFGGEGGPGE